MLGMFETKERATRDRQEVTMLRRKYGGELEQVLTLRAEDGALNSRDRSHWKRILRKSRRAVLL